MSNPDPDDQSLEELLKIPIGPLRLTEAIRISHAIATKTARALLELVEAHPDDDLSSEDTP